MKSPSRPSSRTKSAPSIPTEPTRANVLGALSLVFWMLALVVTLSYHVYVLRGDNRGEDGVLALMALVWRKVRGRARYELIVLEEIGDSLLISPPENR